VAEETKTNEKKHKGSKAKKWKRVAKGGGKKACKVEGFKRAYRPRATATSTSRCGARAS
jgi:hypothetical protein